MTGTLYPLTKVISMNKICQLIPWIGTAIAASFPAASVTKIKCFMLPIPDGILSSLLRQLDMAIDCIGCRLLRHLHPSRLPHVVRQVRLRLQHEGQLVDEE